MEVTRESLMLGDQVSCQNGKGVRKWCLNGKCKCSRENGMVWDEILLVVARGHGSCFSPCVADI